MLFLLAIRKFSNHLISPGTKTGWCIGNRGVRFSNHLISPGTKTFSVSGISSSVFSNHLISPGTKTDGVGIPVGNRFLIT